MKLLKSLALTTTTAIPLISLIACSNPESEVEKGESFDVYFIETPAKTYRLQYRVSGLGVTTYDNKKPINTFHYEPEKTSVRIKNIKTGKVLEFPFTEVKKFGRLFNKSLGFAIDESIDYLMFDLTDIPPGTYRTDKVVWRTYGYDKTIYLKPEQQISFEIKK